MNKRVLKQTYIPHLTNFVILLAKYFIPILCGQLSRFKHAHKTEQSYSNAVQGQ